MCCILLWFVYIQSSKKSLILHPNFWPAFLQIFFLCWFTENFRSTPIYHWSKAAQIFVYTFICLKYCFLVFLNSVKRICWIEISWKRHQVSWFLLFIHSFSRLYLFIISLPSSFVTNRLLLCLNVLFFRGCFFNRFKNFSSNSLQEVLVRLLKFLWRMFLMYDLQNLVF